jgi:hypothetical protein
MAIRVAEWQQWQERQRQDASVWAAVLVADAIVRYPCDRNPFYTLHRAAGIPIRSAKQEALRRELRKVSDGIQG